MITVLQLGTAKVDITPSYPVPLAGFTHRKGCFEDVMHRLYVRIWYFQQSDEDGTVRRSLLIQADLIWWGSDRVPGIRQSLAEQWGLDEENIILHATHTHSGPQTSNQFTPSLGSPDPAYLDNLALLIAKGVELAVNNVEPVTIERGIGHCELGVYRRKLVDGQVKMAPNEMGPTDPELNVFRFRTNSDKIKGVMAHYTCHPTTTGDNFISSEFPGIAMEQVERKLSPGTVASFLQGCCGDIRPALIREGNFYRGNDNDVQRLGEHLADAIEKVLLGDMQPVAPSMMRSRVQTVELPIQQLPSRSRLEHLRKSEGVYGEWSRMMLDEPSRLQLSLPLELTLLHVANGLSFLAMNGEVVVDYGLFIKRRSGGRILPLPYSNGMIGYVPSAKQVEEGGYEGEDSAYYFALPGAFDTSLESILCTAIENIIREN
jgi:hypothetical protein